MKKSYRRKRATRKPYKKRSYRKRASNVPEWASLSVKRSVTAPGGGTFQSNTLYSLLNTQLIDFDRAVTVAQAYQHYRIKKIALTFKPLYDNFLASGGAVSKPNLYYMIDKSGSIPTNVTLEGLKQMGARPTQLDEKNLVRSWTPSVLLPAQYAPGVGGVSSAKYQVSPWLSTNADPTQAGWVPSGIDHLGIYFYVDQLINPTNIYAYTIEMEVQFQFKKPLDTDNVGDTPAQKVTLAVKNRSPDGIVGGGDGV